MSYKIYLCKVGDKYLSESNQPTDIDRCAVFLSNSYAHFFAKRAGYDADIEEVLVEPKQIGKAPDKAYYEKYYKVHYRLMGKFYYQILAAATSQSARFRFQAAAEATKTNCEIIKVE
jgi:hypothetical protein